MRQTVQQVMLLFKIFDEKATGGITSYQLGKVARESGKELTHEETRNILKNCSQDSSRIKPDEFLYIMTRPD